MTDHGGGPSSGGPKPGDGYKIEIASVRGVLTPLEESVVAARKIKGDWKTLADHIQNSAVFDVHGAAEKMRNEAYKVIAETDPLGNTTHTEWDETNRHPIAVTDPLGHTSRYRYDDQGHLAGVEMPDGNVTEAVYDDWGLPVEVREPNGAVWRHTYDHRRCAHLHIRPERRHHALHLRRLRSPFVGHGRSGPHVRSEWTYDAAGRPATLTTADNSLHFAYDAAGRETSRTFGDDVALTQSWDSLDRLTTQALTHGNTSTLLQHREYTYRADDHLTEIRELTSGTRRFDLDPVGRVTAVHAHGWTETYAYDSVGNLTHATAPDHEAPGDRSFTGTIIHRAGRTTYEHDTQGRLVRRTRKLLNGQTRTWTYTWNAEDRLTHATTPDGEHWHYTYDPLGRRTAEQRLAEDGTAADRIHFTWDGTRLAEQTTTDGATTTWDYAPGTHRPLSQTERHTPPEPMDEVSSILHLADTTPQSEYDARFHAIITDLVGTPTELVTPDGTLAWQHRTTLWGTPLPAPPDGTACPLRFPGQYADPETGLNYNYFRHYDPETARYITPDPLGLTPAPNPATYIHNPHTWADPFGLAPECPNKQRGPGFRTPSEAGISPNDARRIQNAADKAGQPIIVVGSRTSGTAKGERVTVRAVDAVETSGRLIIQIGQTTQSWTGIKLMLYSSLEAGDHLRESERIINQVAQGLRSMDEAVSWFSSLEQVEQKAALQEVVRYSMQAHATAEDGRVGLSQSGVKPTMTPAVLIVREPILEQMGKIINLPPNEYVKSFRVLLSTFTVADNGEENQSVVAPVATPGTTFEPARPQGEEDRRPAVQSAVPLPVGALDAVASGGACTARSPGPRARRRELTAPQAWRHGSLPTDTYRSYAHRTTDEGESPVPHEIDPSFLALPLRALADAALARARALGADHADFRFERVRSAAWRLRDGKPAGSSDTTDLGYAVRVVHGGSWGFASGVDLGMDAAARVAAQAVAMAKLSGKVIQASGSEERVELADEPVHADRTWVSSYEINPFDVPDADKTGLLTDWSERLLGAAGVAHADASLLTVQENKFYADTAGTTTTQQRVRVHPQLTAVAVDPDSGEFESMRTLAPPVGRGWEYLTGAGGRDWDAELAEIPELLAEKMRAPSVEAGAYDLVIDPSNLWLTIHESIGHATELDRALGYEAAYAGTSFATFDQLGKLKYGSEIMNVTGDRTAEHGLATIGYDDEGVAAQSWDLVRDGTLVGYQLDRRIARLTGFERSNGCAFADSPGHVPVQRMANVSLQPAPDGPSTEELIGGVQRGLYLVGDRSWSIDMQRYNFQFTAQRAFRIENGRLAGQVRDFAYQATTTDFWGSMAAVGGPQTYVLGGAFNCGKAQPGQVAAVSHGCPSALFRNVNILNTTQEAGA